MVVAITCTTFPDCLNRVKVCFHLSSRFRYNLQSSANSLHTLYFSSSGTLLNEDDKTYRTKYSALRNAANYLFPIRGDSFYTFGYRRSRYR